MCIFVSLNEKKTFHFNRICAQIYISAHSCLAHKKLKNRSHFIFIPSEKFNVFGIVQCELRMNFYWGRNDTWAPK